MVARIVDAGQRVLITHGYDGASTNRIAEAAGISPGSLYQYFPNKDAVVAAVIERYTGEVADRVRARVLANLARDPEVAVPETISELLDALGNDRELLRAVVEQTPRLSAGTTVLAFEQQIGELALVALTMRAGLYFSQGLRPRTPGIGGAAPGPRYGAGVDFESASWMLVRVVEHLTIRYLLDGPPIPRERFVADISRLVLNYFREPPTRAERE
ncbi:TetR family transcriptional regulator [Nocardia huaxiensis]|uniref:TetR/AcrR family transcriptional regulator n=1 Tax=Nocardia huaxiensis TaxID=2755382 RepID=A0A7D6Z626_9NOCA|nr:TetR family transcriptional regulator [Nocardia huaxiensis]QLY27648.1 TetR/AcrR family transcriptional regulator [Nocardia huaxiensis]UFS98966.1 TetR/AcrR family transcriptional regulator [Nocardia huaxiensis]